MAVITPPVLTLPGPSPDRSDRATFTARSIARDDFIKNTQIPQLTLALANVAANAADTAANAAAISIIAGGAAAAQAAVIAQSPVANAAAAAAAAAQAAVYAGQAQATNPDSPIRINPRKITADFTVGSGYNAQSTGPITIAEGVTVTVQDNATYAIQ